jgi:hypothetical protein
MRRIIKLTLSASIICLGLGIGFVGFAHAQETSTANTATANTATATSSDQNAEGITQEVNLDENVSAADLGIKEPKLLPDSPLYFLKNWARGIQSFFTFNPVKKFELKSKFASEKLIEMKEMIKQNKNPKLIEKATENYENEIDRVKKISDKIKEKAEKNPKLNKFLDKWTRHQLLQQRLLEKLGKQAPAKAFKKIEAARQKHLERFKDVMLKLENNDKLPERLEKAIREQKGSRFKGIKALEVLRRLENTVPDEAKEAIKKAEENILKNTQERLEKMPQQKREMLKDYIEKISGDPMEHMKILQDITTVPQLKGLRKTLMKRAAERIEKKAEEKGCPQWVPPTPGFCPKGRVVIKRDANGCPLPPKCISLPRKLFPIKKFLNNKKRACTTLWRPVCGENGKTYSNGCFAKIAGAKIAHKGICKNSENENKSIRPMRQKGLENLKTESTETPNQSD